jgi:uncharacterized Rmd1/YagE family protein
MTALSFDNTTELRTRALFIGERLDLRAFEKSNSLALSPLTISAGKRGCAVLFRYGVVVLFGLSVVEEITLLGDLDTYIRNAFPEPESEEVLLVIDKMRNEGVGVHDLFLHEFTVERLQLVAEILAKSVVLAHYEESVAASFQLIEPLAENLKQHGRGGSRGRELLRHIGETLSIQGRMVGRVEIVEKPAMLWNHPEYERLYARLEDEYELRERHLALERKLELISRTAETLLGLLQTNRSLRVEWYITLLIVFEIMITLYEKIF